MISAFAVIGNCPMPEIINEKENGKLVAMYVISSEVVTFTEATGQFLYAYFSCALSNLY